MLPIKSLSSTIYSDETNLTGTQKTSLIGAWGIIKRDINVHAKNIFILFFEKYPKYLKYFNFTDDCNTDDIAENKCMHAHSMNVLNAIGTLIEYGLRDPALFQCSLNKLVKNHLKRNIKEEDIENIGEVLIDYLGKTLARQKTNTLDESWITFMKTISEAFSK